MLLGFELSISYVVILVLAVLLSVFLKNIYEIIYIRKVLKSWRKKE